MVVGSVRFDAFMVSAAIAASVGIDVGVGVGGQRAMGDG